VPDRYDAAVHPPVTNDTWIDLTDAELPIGPIYDWCVRPDCGAVVLFSGTVRDHAVDEQGEMRSGVEHLTYEAYETQTVPRFAAIADEVRARWPVVRRIALLHRVGRLQLGESSVVAAVSSPHRPEAFEAARFAIDALKASAPIWKQEAWSDGEGGVVEAWGTGAQDLVDPAHVTTAPQGASAPVVRGAAT
jgi:molybdopterin synthase catalytic subunit